MHPTDRKLSQPGGLAEQLYRMRKAAGLTGDQLAGALGWGEKTGRTKVSKIENGKQVPSREEVRAWATAAGHAEAADDLLDMLADVQAVHRNWRGQLRRGHAAIQDDYDRRTREARRFRNAETSVIPGLLQTPGYARAMAAQTAKVWGTSDVAAAVEARLRRQEVLWDTSRTFEFAIAEPALRLLPCPPQVMLGQMDRLLLALDLEHVTIGIVPMGVQLDITPLDGFLLLDDTLISEALGGDNYPGEEEAAAYARVFDLLMAEALTGDEARRLIAAAAADLGKGT